MAENQGGNREIRGALAESRRLFFSCALFSMAVNLLMLTGSMALAVTTQFLAARVTTRSGSKTSMLRTSTPRISCSTSRRWTRRSKAARTLSDQSDLFVRHHLSLPP